MKSTHNMRTRNGRLNSKQTVTFSPRELAAGLKEVFEVYESTDGKILATEIGDVLRALDENPTEADLRRITQNYQPDDKITFDEFLCIYEPITKYRLTETPEDFIESFRHFDKKGNGNIRYEDIIELLTQHGEKLSKSEVEELLHGQIDVHGNVNIEAFVKKIMGYDEEEADLSLPI